MSATVECRSCGAVFRYFDDEHCPDCRCGTCDPEWAAALREADR